MTEDEHDRMSVARCLDGEADAFDEIVERYQGPLYNAIVRMGADREDARDICQRAFLKAYEHLGDYDPERRFFSWLYRVAINEAINVIKAKPRWEPLKPDMEDAHRNPEEELQVAEQDRELQCGLLQLEMKYRLALITRHFLQLSYEEMAVVLDLPEKTVKSRLFTARQLLREALENLRHVR
jgi:RNA polymerase sigma-70 factor (ECF subfamily)